MADVGRLLVCATPIGNLGDVTARVLEALRTADAVLAEDTRVTRKLFGRYQITTPLERFDEHVAASRTPEVVARIAAGQTLALVSDAGTPGISDPGAVLVDAALAAELTVEVLPGASAIVTALVASGLPTDAFYFGGFFPRKTGDRRKALDSLASLEATLVFYESPHRTASALKSIAERFPARQGAMARELTKLHEEVVRGVLPDLADEIGRRESLKGEVVLLVGPPAQEERAGERLGAEALRGMVEELMSSGVSRSEAVKLVAGRTGMPRRRVYEVAVEPRDLR